VVNHPTINQTIVHGNIVHSQYVIQAESLREQVAECPENALLVIM